jgi:hypothetical protein
MKGKRQAALVRMKRVLERTAAKQAITANARPPAPDYALAYRARLRVAAKTAAKKRFDFAQSKL